MAIALFAAYRIFQSADRFRTLPAALSCSLASDCSDSSLLVPMVFPDMLPGLKWNVPGCFSPGCFWFGFLLLPTNTPATLTSLRLPCVSWKAELFPQCLVLFDRSLSHIGKRAPGMFVPFLCIARSAMREPPSSSKTAALSCARASCPYVN